ncbi:hypothetical protein [Tenacibaculum sp. 190524A02b]|uniref:hypothetical protein n=1 Tax=Tenacibaculum vairaonense TaxID=3137860 RepID=UPI0031FA87ED
MPHFKINLEIEKLETVKSVIDKFEINLDHDYFSSEILSSDMEDHFTLKLLANVDDLKRLIDLLPL